MQTLPTLAFIVGLAFLAASWRFLSNPSNSWEQVAPWIYFWLAASLYIFLQPWVREVFNIELELNGNKFTRVYWLQTVKYWSFFTAYWLLAWVVSRQRGRARDVIVVAVILMALFESLYGMIAFAGGQQTIIGIWPKERYLESVTGSFFNRNHLAGFLAVAMPLGASYLLARKWDPGYQRVPIIKICVTTLYLLITGGALIGTASRLGIFSAMVGFILWGVLFIRNELSESRFRWIVLTVIIGVPLLAGLWFGPQTFVDRLLAIDQATGRLQIWTAMLESPTKIWVLGIGAGSFHDVFKLIHPVGLEPSIWRAHSEYLQVVYEFGLVGILILLPFLVIWLVCNKPDGFDSIQRGALAGVVGVMVHNIADFDLQVPGTAVVFWVVVGILMTAGNVRPTGSNFPGSLSRPDNSAPGPDTRD
ncbi:O-antigen ligase family protein [Pseudomonadota bacterium]